MSTTMTPITDMTLTPPAHQGLASRAMNVALHLSMWNGRRLDRKTTGEVLAERNAEPDAGKFEKNLVPPKALEPVSRAHTQARSRHYRLTLPWDENGVRILAAAAFFDYSQAMMEERVNCENSYKGFCAEYPRYVQEAPRRLGSKLFVAADFPPANNIGEKFGFKLVMLPVPDKDDFRVDLGIELQEQIRESIEETVNERYAAAQRDLWERLLDTVKHFAQTMAAEDKIFRNSTVEKLGELARLAPKLSLTPDPRLEEICKQVLQITDGAAPAEFRENPTLRREASDRARETLKRIEESMKGAF